MGQVVTIPTLIQRKGTEGQSGPNAKTNPTCTWCIQTKTMELEGLVARHEYSSARIRGSGLVDSAATCSNGSRTSIAYTSAICGELQIYRGRSKTFLPARAEKVSAPRSRHSSWQKVFQTEPSEIVGHV
eukprot:6471847-Amphidinium_carterae.2